MALDVGTRLGPYEIVASIGAGGMGEVYRARDTRLDRSVAIKVLAPSLAGDPERRARFEREAKTIAGLNHPHICSLHDVGDYDGSPFLVMEHVAGETLASRLQKGPLPVEQALTVATEIAEALSVAHRAGIIHRDLKPGNVMLTKAGVKLLDFGLAKLAASPALAATSVATAEPITEKGLVLGTVPYMAPEQLEGKEADARGDIFSFGTLLYEMVCGKRAFEGQSHASVIAAILEREPVPLSTIQPLTPAALDHLVRRCLAKAPDDRPDTAHDVADDLRWMLDTNGAGARSNPRTMRRGLRTVLVIAFGLAMVAVGAGLVWWLRPVTPAGPPTHATVKVSPADGLWGAGTGGTRRLLSRTAIALSPDGRLLVFCGRQGKDQSLYARHLGRSEPSPIKGTEGGSMPFFSANGQWIGFWRDQALWKIRVDGGTAVPICKTPLPTGASWGADDMIVFGNDGELWHVRADPGRDPKRLLAQGGEAGWKQRLPHVLPGGKGVVYTAGSPNDPTAMVLDAATGKTKPVITHAADARYVPTGHLLFVGREGIGREGRLQAVPFDLRSLKTTGETVAVLDGDDVMQAINTNSPDTETGAAQVAVADSGVLAYVHGGAFPDPGETSITIVDIHGNMQELPGMKAGSYVGPQLSQNGERIVGFTRSFVDNSLWVYDLRRRHFESLLPPGVSPIWTPDGKSIVFARSEGAGAPNQVFQVAADGMSEPQPVTPRTAWEQLPACWGPVGELLYLEWHPDSGWDIMVMPKGQPESARVLVRTDSDDWFPAVSPDGRWLAYTTRRTGRLEVYVQPYPPAGGEPVPVSPDGGHEPVWSSDKRLFFHTGRGAANGPAVYSVEYTATDQFTPARPQPVTQMAKAFSRFVGAPPNHGWDIMPDGKTFVFAAFRERGPDAPPPEGSQPPPTQIELVLNWFEELKAKARVK